MVLCKVDVILLFWCLSQTVVVFIFSSCLYVLIYVDDIVIIGTSSRLISILNSILALKQLGNLDYFFGIEVKHLPNGSLLLSQGKYIQVLLQKTGMAETEGISTHLVLLNCQNVGQITWKILVITDLLLVQCSTLQ